MVETAVFSIFQRPPLRAPAVAPADAPPIVVTPVPEPRPATPEPAFVAAEEPAFIEAVEHEPHEAAAPPHPPFELTVDDEAEAEFELEAEPEEAEEPTVAAQPEPAQTLADALQHELPIDELPRVPGVWSEPVDFLPEPEPESEPEALSALTNESHDALALAGVPLSSDLLGLANPDVIAVQARMQRDEPVPLSATSSGLYRPHDFRPAPWSGFAYDHIGAARSGVVAGTRILTNRGEVEAESLLPGDSALALRGPALLPITWIGRSHLKVPAVAIEAGALGPDMPRRRLVVGPDQLIYAEPDPVPARDMVNGGQIRFTELTVDLFHIDVGQSEVLFAEGLPIGSSSRAALQAAG